MALVRRHHRVAVVPVELRLGVEPECATRALRDLLEDLGVRLAAVRARVAEHDHRGARAEVVDDLLQELEPHAPVIGIARDVGDAALAADSVRDGAEVALALEDLRDLGDPLDEDEAPQLPERVVERVQDGEEEHACGGNRRGDVAENVDLRPARVLGPILQPQRHAAGVEGRPHGAAHVHDGPAAPAALLVPHGRQAPLELGDGAMDGGQILGRAGGEGAVELGQRARRGKLLGALDQRALELAAEVALEAIDLPPVELHLARLRAAALGLQAQRAADALHVHADHTRALASAPEGGDRQASHVAHLPVAAVRDRLPHGLAKLVEVEAVAPVIAPVLADSLLERLGLGRPEEEAIEEKLENPAVLLRLRHRGRERLAEVVLGRPGHVLQRGEGVQDLRRPDCDALAAQLLAERDKPRREPRRQRAHPDASAPRPCTPPSFMPTRSATRSMSVRCLTMMLMVRAKSEASMSSAPRSSRARAQSIDSAIEGGFLRSSWRTMWTTSTRRLAKRSSSSGVCRRTISISRSTSG